ncbi:cholecystokinin receptor type A-like [Mizuhopecten yessoensis]|uniref:cholecystokinin receptor type A-like n=1 Tax=Mizuhopecten yessoensis TaxID=6573 RepID=UPI000B45CE9F|nr:cholecystokinin receptor type A-like [Mizuhopecten yessoensis]
MTKEFTASLNMSNVTLEYVEWREFVNKGLLFTFFLSLLSITGTLGNAVVFLTNLRCDKPSNYRTLIQCLALVDFLSCAVGIPGYVLKARYQYTIESNTLCRVLTVFHFYVGITSLTILSFSAIERFRKTCRPFGSQFNRKEIKRVCVCLNIFGLLLSAPSAYAFNSEEVNLQNGSLIGRTCKLEKDRIFSRVYISVFIFCLIFCVLVDTVFYSLIGRKIISQNKRGPKTVSFRNRPVKTPEVSSDRDRKPDSSQRMSNVSLTSISQQQDHNNATKRNTSLKGKALYEKSVQISVMFLVCSLLSCASFVPLFVFRCMEIYDAKLRERTFEALGPMAAILNRFHVINHVINPIVYCLLSSNFRDECLSLFKCRKK